jgi:hypothetical protein
MTVRRIVCRLLPVVAVLLVAGLLPVAASPSVLESGTANISEFAICSGPEICAQAMGSIDAGDLNCPGVPEVECQAGHAQY